MTKLQCIFAFLTCSSPNSRQKGRLVIAGGDNLPFYGVYHPPSYCSFPMPKINPDQIVKIERASKTGSHMAKYCSTNIPIAEILALVTNGLVTVTQASNLKTNSYGDAETKCLDHIEHLSRTKDIKATINMSETLRVEKCSIASITNLCFRGKISVLGNYSGFVPPPSRNTISIVTDRPIKMRSLIEGTEMYKGWGHIENQALGWYRGNLHLFQKNEIKNVWVLRTSLFPSVQNGVLIATYLTLSSYPVDVIDDGFIYTTKSDEYSRTVAKGVTDDLSEEEVMKRYSYLLYSVIPMRPEKVRGDIGALQH
ncbi:BgTH12-07767 [Blumeria graminis f. sp. triticale]|uniref:BgTH12-07767 n=1 Tax=Blumeria graminis f. sp. triticale TaxID=1689686 RepID=A0A9W4GK42_BLUGR|nr:BgTH12-07767 [Blumeria graminis f. sp. triticale]